MLSRQSSLLQAERSHGFFPPLLPVITIGAILSCFTPLIESAASDASEVDNFALIDHLGKHHELDYYRRSEHVRGIALFVQGNGCPLVRKRVPDLKRLRDEYQPKGILFAMLNANPQDEREDLAEEAGEFDIDIPILKDSSQLVVQMLGVDRTAEMILIDSKSCNIVYRGPIDDRMSYQTERPKAEHYYLKDAMNALLTGGEIEHARIEAPGCKISMLHPSDRKIDYATQVAPILKSRCVTCHTKGGVGPFAMSSYKKVRGWSEMMEEVIVTKQMPPWHADPHIGTFSNASGITDDEAATIVQWIRQGSKRGEGKDPLEGYRPPSKDWALGTPDAVLTIPEQKVPAEGIVEYRYEFLKSPFDRDVWLSAAEVNPGNKRVLHHAIVVAQHESAKRSRNLSGKWITGYAPGTDPLPCPDGSGIFLPKDHVLKIELHYTVSGKQETDATQLGLYVMEEPPAKELKTGVVVHARFKIPPHAEEYQESYTQNLDKDVRIYGLNPHMHFRGKYMNFALRDPNGDERPLLSVPKTTTLIGSAPTSSRSQFARPQARNSSFAMPGTILL